MEEIRSLKTVCMIWLKAAIASHNDTLPQF